MIALALVYFGVAALGCALLGGLATRVWARAAVIVVLPALAFAVWQAAQPPTGWPAVSHPPKQAQFQWAVVREPDQLSGDRGEIDLWLTPPDSARPRSYRLPYSRQTHKQVEAALQEVKQGRPVAMRLVHRRKGERGLKVRPQFYRVPPPELPAKN